MIGRRVGRRVGGGKPEIYLYNAGDKCIAVTGGFTFTKTGGDSTGAITYGKTSFVIQLPQWSTYLFETINNINFPSYSKINIIYETSSLGSYSQWSIPTVADILLNGQVVIPSPACITKTYNNEKLKFNIANLKSGFLRINQIWLS